MLFPELPSSWKEQLIFTEANEGSKERGDGRELGGATDPSPAG
jgi:hypothetical protein